MALSSEPILIVDDDELMCQAFDAILQAAGWTRRTLMSDPRRVMDAVREGDFATILLDLNMPHVTGRELLEQLTNLRPDIPIIILTLEDKVDVAVECMRIGAFDFMTKPVDENRLVNSVAHALRVHALHDEVRVLATRAAPATIGNPEHFASIITVSESMRKLFAYVETIARSPRSVLITGESGTGKELFARSIHAASGRTGAFVPINVAGLDDTVFSDTLFGHRRGAFTGADTTRRGLVEQAADGTLFLDEIGDLDNAAQVKLLRLLQEEEYYPLGSDVAERSSARIVAATNADLLAMQREGRFRRDLFYRLVGHRIDIPPLRERDEDIPVLVHHFFRESYETMGEAAQDPPEGAAALFLGYEFPGNVRELQSIVFDVVSRAAGAQVSIEDLLSHPVLAARSPSRSSDTDRISYTGALPTLEEAESFLFREALRETDGNQSAAARLLGVSQSTLSRWIARTRS